jgi:hypothetical protein
MAECFTRSTLKLTFLTSVLCMYVCMYVEGVGQKSGPCTATFNDLLCFPYCLALY